MTGGLPSFSDTPTIAVEQIGNYLIDHAPDHQDWSIGEIPNIWHLKPQLLDWCSRMTLNDWTLAHRKQRVWLGLALLWVEACVAREHVVGRTIWPTLADPTVVPWQDPVRKILFLSNATPTPAHKDLLKRTALAWRIRHTFREDDAQNWLRLLHLQYGFSKHDLTENLTSWLSGTDSSIGVEVLLQGKDTGALAFQKAWACLKSFRRGNLSKSNLHLRLSRCPWIDEAWRSAVIQAAEISRPKSMEYTEAYADEVVFAEAPILVWPSGEEPRFETYLCNLGELKLCEQELHLRVGNQFVSQLVLQTDGSYYCPQGDIIRIPNHPVAAFRLDSGLPAEDGKATIQKECEWELWDPQVDGTIYSVKSGRRYLEGERPRVGSPLWIITPDDCTVEPKPIRQAPLGGGYIVHEIEGKWNNPPRVLLDGEPVWELETGKEQDLPFDAGFWFDPICLNRSPWTDLTAPWDLPVHFRLPSGWNFRRLRWRKEDGTLLDFKELPKTLPVTERDLIRRVQLRIQMESAGGKVASVSITDKVRAEGVLRWFSEDRVVRHSVVGPLTVAEAKSSLWSFLLPSLDFEITQRPVEYYLQEGSVLRGTLSKRRATLSGLGGYGARLFVVEDPHVEPKRHMNLAECVLDQGMITAVFPNAAGTSLQILGGELQRTDRHIFHAWYTDAKGQAHCEPIPEGDLDGSPGSWTWMTNVTQVHAVALM